MESRSTLVTVYDYGSLSPYRIAEIADALQLRVAFVVPDTAHTRSARSLLESVGVVIPTAGRSPAELIRACRALRPAGVVTFSEPQLRLTAELADALGCAFHAPSDIDAIVRKDRQRERFAAAGLEAIRFRVVERLDQIDEAIAHVGLPAVIKPTYGAASRNTIAVSDEKDCRQTLEFLLNDGQERTLLLEELLVGRHTDHPWGDFIAVDCVAAGDRVEPRFVTSKFAAAEPFRDRGGYATASVVPEPDLAHVRDLAGRAVRALNIRTGLADVEIKLTPTGPRLIEVNGRLGGTVDDLAVRSGNPSPAEIAIRSALGLPIDAGTPPPGPIAFHYHLIPPLAARAVADVRAPLRVKRLPHVERLIVHARRGDPVDWRAGTESRVASVIGTTGTHAELADVVAAIESVPWIDYEF
ncbi:ATP-grasp domain-containing protein [Catenuloplanes atrovinosus]|uniref:Biotin carboxylase n=1 Tax=Catenuloplanes atrovinosus TaxID=137266 RepID=A0AAE3YKP0_9ACTN|nr:ATP-grasp domain-containing protein [Catenuloplanes atrovinosus]MDR7275588.1 biotin carboxylase [Catenuloplanes atrovinosus]